ncbi:hypothetical protein C8R41DRAFT_867054 [Lentinula lateritia]|uniref:Uncharacterized protein n=1 Tax=Lentinula lateritia TaxID=40482 RepID=A0ABQ8VGP4_9AGAR|nr:hypothetical protein C8R41DRAFT_867054 [Lentinula lateritia]
MCIQKFGHTGFRIHKQNYMLDTTGKSRTLRPSKRPGGEHVFTLAAVDGYQTTIRFKSGRKHERRSSESPLRPLEPSLYITLNIMMIPSDSDFHKSQQGPVPSSSSQPPSPPLISSTTPTTTPPQKQEGCWCCFSCFKHCFGGCNRKRITRKELDERKQVVEGPGVNGLDLELGLGGTNSSSIREKEGITQTDGLANGEQESLPPPAYTQD